MVTASAIIVEGICPAGLKHSGAFLSCIDADNCLDYQNKNDIPINKMGKDKKSDIVDTIVGGILGILLLLAISEAIL
jgi:hypothetical protein